MQAIQGLGSVNRATGCAVRIKFFRCFRQMCLAVGRFAIEIACSESVVIVSKWK